MRKFYPVLKGIIEAACNARMILNGSDPRSFFGDSFGEWHQTLLETRRHGMVVRALNELVRQRSFDQQYVQRASSIPSEMRHCVLVVAICSSNPDETILIGFGSAAIRTHNEPRWLA